MDFGTSIKTCFSKYAVFAGRASRSEFWWFALFSGVGGIVTGIADLAVFGGGTNDPQMFGTLFSLATLLPSLGVAVRRLHDLDRSGWWWWLIMIPLVGWIIMIVWYATLGSIGANRFGEDPLGNTGSGSGPGPSTRRTAEDDLSYSHSNIPSVPKH